MPSRSHLAAVCLALALAVGLTAAPAEAGEVERSVPFELDEWIDLDVEDGPITLHRIMIREDVSRVKKSQIFRPGRGSRYTETVEIRLEFSNEATSDWDIEMQIEWKDANGDVIDGYESKEELDEGERHAFVDNDLSTLRYGLERAKTLDISLRFYPE